MALKTKRIEGRKDAQWNQRLCLSYLCMKSQTTTKEIRVNVKSIALDLDIPGRTVRQSLARLEASGLIAKCAFQYGPDRRYTLEF